MADELNPGSKRAYVRAIHRIHHTQFEEPGQKTEAFKSLAKDRPGRTSAAGRGLAVGSSTPTGSAERQAEVAKWRALRPGGGSPSGATHEQWVAWGSANPNRASMASGTLRAARKKKS